MRQLIARAARAAAVLMLLAASASTPAADPPLAAGPAAAPAQDQAPRKCCLTNPGYSGTCEVQPAKDESCAQVLDYLNNSMSQGKSYCNNSTIRGGWKLAGCEKK